MSRVVQPFADIPPVWVYRGMLSESGMQTFGRCVLGGSTLCHDMLLLLGSSAQSGRAVSGSGVVVRDVVWVESVSMMHTVGRCRAVVVIDRVMRRWTGGVMVFELCRWESVGTSLLHSSCVGGAREAAMWSKSCSAASRIRVALVK